MEADEVVVADIDISSESQAIPSISENAPPSRRIDIAGQPRRPRASNLAGRRDFAERELDRSTRKPAPSDATERGVELAAGRSTLSGKAARPGRSSRTLRMILRTCGCRYPSRRCFGTSRRAL